ncbi:MAG: NADP-dependent oxidoreductase [Deltaproteobacteria bacterium]|nr:NADP-dependent oxidoreductase [Deltaproteobacteria bacterium]
MQPTIPQDMKAAAIDQFGGPEELHAERLPVPKPKADEVLIRVDAAGIGVWDKWVRSGEFLLGEKRFPMIIGNDGAGEVVAVGDKVKRFRPGDRVYAYSMEGGFYAEYACVKQACVGKLPEGLSAEQAGALGADGVTALRGLQDTLKLQPGEKLLIFGASGGIGHLAVQLAQRMGAQVFAVASGDDGVKLAQKLGADGVVDGKHGAVVDALKTFAPDGLDCALVLTSGKGLDAALGLLKKDGRVAYPNGVEPEPSAPSGITARAYDGVPDADVFDRLNALIAKGPFHVQVRTYKLDDAAQAHRDVEKHHLGKFALKMN